jgi:hypothetical protein
LVYKTNGAPFFGADFNQFTDTVSHDPSRKSFLGKLTGIVALVGLAPRLLVKSAAAAPASEKANPVLVRPDSRAVARRVESV